LIEPETGGHARLMDSVYRRQRYIYDLTRRYYLFGRDTAIRELDLKPGDRLVEIGCGTARNLVKIARRYPGATLYGLDASAEMLKTAAAAIERAGLGSRIRLAQGYGEAISPGLFGETRPFDVALFSYSLSMIPDWKRALHAATDALSAGGSIRIVDFGDLKGAGWIAESLLRAWLALFHVSPRSEILTALAGAETHKEMIKLRMLPYRYAFVLALPKRTIESLSFVVAR
jgi:S-adenosylmethionine-diacylgycerolhomoserine-N-methlytransferase